MRSSPEVPVETAKKSERIFTYSKKVDPVLESAPAAANVVSLNVTSTERASTSPNLSELARLLPEKPKFGFEMTNERNQNVTVDVGNEDNVNKLTALKGRVGQIAYSRTPESMLIQLTAMYRGEARVSTGATLSKSVSAMESLIAAADRAAETKVEVAPGKIHATSGRMLVEPPKLQKSRSDIPATFQDKFGSPAAWPSNLSEEQKYIITRLAQTASSVGMNLYQDSGSFFLVDKNDPKNPQKFNFLLGDSRAEEAMLTIMIEKVEQKVKGRISKPPAK